MGRARRSLAVILFAVIFIVAGCQGKSGGDSPTIPSVPLKSSSLRIEQPNDSWTETISGVYTIGSATHAVTGTITTIVTTTTKASPTDATACNIEATTADFIVDSRNSTDKSYTYFTQDAAGNFLFHGDGDVNSDRWITTPSSGFVKEIPSPLTVGASDSATITYSNGDTETASYTVSGKEYLSTDIANFESYKVNLTITTNYISGQFTKQVAISTTWVVPVIGIVKREFDISYYAGNTISETFHYTSTLTATNIPF